MTSTLAQAHPGIAALLQRQQGVLSARQAAAYGLAHETLRQRVLRGIWQRLLPGVYALQCGPPTWRQWLIAALVYAGDGSMLTGAAALAEHGLLPPGTCPGPGLPCIDVLVPHTTRRQNVPGEKDAAGAGNALGTPAAPALRIRRSTRLPAPVDADTLTLAPPARAVVDTCLTEAQDGAGEAVETAVERALATGRVTLAELEAELARAPRRHSARLRGCLARYRAQARATATERLLRAVGAGVLPHEHPLRDVAVYSGREEVARAAAVWPSRAVAAAVDASPREIDSLERLGFAVVQVTPQNVAADLPAVLRRIDRVLAHRPQATLPAGVAMLPGAQRVLTASSPARTGDSKTFPRGGIGQV